MVAVKDGWLFVTPSVPVTVCGTTTILTLSISNTGEENSEVLLTSGSYLDRQHPPGL
jgi:hypothetical protein